MEAGLNTPKTNTNKWNRTDIKEYENVSNGSLYWLYIRQQCDYTSTDLVELSGCGYGPVTAFFMRRKNPYQSEIKKNPFLDRLFAMGVEGEKKSLEDFATTYRQLNVSEPYIVTFNMGIFHIGSSCDGFIRNDKGRIVCPIEVKTVTRSVCSKRYSLSHIVVKYRWIVQCFLEAFALGIKIALLIIYNRHMNTQSVVLLHFSDLFVSEFWNIMEDRMLYGTELYDNYETTPEANIPNRFRKSIFDQQASRLSECITAETGVTNLIMPTYNSPLVTVICEIFNNSDTGKCDEIFQSISSLFPASDAKPLIIFQK